MSIWGEDREYGLLAVAAEDVARDAAQKLQEQTKRAGRAIQGLMAEPRCL